MIRRIIAIILLVMIGIAPLAVANAARYCGPCNKTTNWGLVCKGGKDHDSVNVTCTGGCSFYVRYNKTYERCTVCKNNFVLYGSHKHYQYHDTTSHNKSVCTY